MIARRTALFGLLAAAALPARAAETAEAPLTVFAAASLTDAMKDAAAAWVKLGHPAPRLSFAASSTLARQIEQGAEANLFASADLKWMDYLAGKGLIAAGTRRDLLTNDLVLVVPASAPKHVTIGPGFDLAGLLGKDGRLAVGDPSNVPAGIYAEAALKKLGIWESVQGHLAPADSVRSALLLVERGEAPAGIVYGTDATVTRQVMIAGVFPADSHPPIVYPFALVKGGDNAQAQALLAFLGGADARRIFAERGFKTE